MSPAVTSTVCETGYRDIGGKEKAASLEREFHNFTGKMRYSFLYRFWDTTEVRYRAEETHRRGVPRIRPSRRLLFGTKRGQKSCRYRREQQENKSGHGKDESQMVQSAPWV